MSNSAEKFFFEQFYSSIPLSVPSVWKQARLGLSALLLSEGRPQQYICVVQNFLADRGLWHVYSTSLCAQDGYVQCYTLDIVCFKVSTIITQCNAESTSNQHSCLLDRPLERDVPCKPTRDGLETPNVRSTLGTPANDDPTAKQHRFSASPHTGQ